MSGTPVACLSVRPQHMKKPISISPFSPHKKTLKSLRLLTWLLSTPCSIRISSLCSNPHTIDEQVKEDGGQRGHKWVNRGSSEDIGSQPGRDRLTRSSARNSSVAAWYPYHIKNDDPLLMARQQQERLSKLEMLKRRGKGPPKKGQGRRAVKRNK